MEVLASRLLLRPTDLDRSLAFYRDTLGLAVYREFGEAGQRGVVFFLGGGFLEVSGRAESPTAPNLALWLQVRDVDASHDELVAKGVSVERPPVTEPWGLREMWVRDPDGLRLAIIEVPADHPLRRR
ncbi:MAG TPA: VOC family protein [Acidimicrobiales bacterium]|jgi:catechol 2,3-dioxygenase-like lactoylglutathione lyase family enzyme